MKLCQYAKKVGVTYRTAFRWLRVKESRPKLLALLKDRSITRIVVEHKDWLTHFGFRYLETLLELQDRTIQIAVER
jgi:predicted site-specific integrase-resolvase